ncbi:MAG: cysteinyl-tRNA synthetase [Syntrophobacter sp. DG_60]|nr:MAG: cysteinyl-tRNA synthetase [Syntrophobacter sp. DG_60]
MRHSYLLSLIGNTPLVKIKRLNPNPKVNILAKLEMFNPSGSVKDRIALAMIEGAEKEGLLTKDKVIIEATSGNTGIGLAMVTAVKGYRFLLAMPESVSIERRHILKAYGAEILLTPADLGTDGAIEEVYRLVREEPDRYFLTDQFNNPYNFLAHYQGTGEEIWKQTKGQVTMVVAGIGTTGTVMGIAKRLKEYNPKIKIIGVEPYLGERIPGLKNLKESYLPGIYKKELLDEKINVTEEQAAHMTRQLAKEEGILVGMSSGAAMHVATGKAKALDKGTIVVIFPDGADRYLSTSLFIERPQLTLRLYNALSRRKEFLRPIIPNQILMYSCGPTVHDIPHLGVCRRLIVADLINRYLGFKGLKVKHVVNITDIDDRTINKAGEEGKTLSELTSFYTEEFLKISHILGIKPANHYPKASEHINEMVEITDYLIKKGYAYEKLHSVYFDIARFKEYGKLSKINLNKIKIGMTVDLDSYEKENPRDFTLFKRCTLPELKAGIYYDTHWGKVRPGWHIECAAMAMHYLDKTIDIHTSGMDLIFPHNENEIAIAEAFTGKPFARYWLHSELIFVNGKKMSRSLGNYLTVYDLLERGYTGEQIRFFLLATHYRRPLNFSLKGLDATRQGLNRINSFIFQVKNCPLGPLYGNLSDLINYLERRFVKVMDDDLNISSGLAAIFEFIHKMNPVLQKSGLSKGDKEKILSTFKKINEALNIMDFAEEEIDSSILRLIKQRDEARKKKDWTKADKIRKELLKQGIELIDTPQGTFWKRRNIK